MERREISKLLLGTILSCIVNTTTLGITKGLIRRCSGAKYCGFILVPNPLCPNANFANIGCYCSESAFQMGLWRLGINHEPAMLNPEKLRGAWNNCILYEAHKIAGLHRDRFNRLKYQFWSVTGAAFALEKPKIYDTNSPFLGIDDSYSEKLRKIDEEMAGELVFKSYLTIPIKHDGRILSVIFIASTFSNSFNKNVLNIIERFSHAVGQCMSTLDSYQLLSTLRGHPVSLTATAKPYSDVKDLTDIQGFIRELEDRLRKGGKGAEPFDIKKDSAHVELRK
jgi:hypothetical protein